MGDSEHAEHAEPAPKRQKQDPDASLTTPVLIMKNEADATAMTMAAGRHLGVLPVPPTANFDPDRPNEVITGPFDGYPGAITCFINKDKMSMSMSNQPVGPEAEQMHANLKQVMAFGPDSGPANVFFRDAVVPKDHKISKDGKKAKISEADMPAWLQEKAHTDQTSGNLKITKKVVGETGDGDKFFKCTVNLCFNGPGAKGPREPKFTEAQKNSWPYELMLAVNELEKAGVEFKASMFVNLEGKRIPLAELFSKFTTSGNGTIYANFYGQPKFSGLKLGWTTGKGSENYNRLLTLPFLRRVQLFAGVSRNDVEEEEADDGLLAACMLAVSDAGAGPAAV